MPTPNTASPMNYTTLLTYLETILVDQGPSADLTTILPAAIQYAEQRIYRDLDFVATRTIDSGAALVANNREFTLPVNNVTFLVVQGISLITPYTATFATGKQNPLEPVSLDTIDWTHPTYTDTGLPTKWAQKNDTTIVVGQTPDQAYPVAVTGTFRPASMSGTVATTYIGNIYPDLLVAACMVFLTGYQRDYGQQADDPKLAQSWENQYSMQMKSAMSEEQRRKGQGTGWSQMSPTPEAAPPRT